jgi:hypothetical protein
VRRGAAAWFTLAVTLFGCGGAETRRSEAKAAPYAPGQYPRLPPMPSDVPVPSDEESQDTPDDQREDDRPTPTEFYVVKTGNYSLFTGRTLNQPIGFDEKVVFIAGDADMNVQGKLLGGLPKGYNYINIQQASILGQWPSAAWLTVREVGEGWTSFRWDEKSAAWTDVMRSTGFLGVAAWTGGSLLGLELTHAGLAESEQNGFRFRVLRGSAAAPEAPRISGRRLCDRHAGALAFAALPSGEVYVVSQDCPSPAPPFDVRLQYWAAGSRKQKTLALPIDGLRLHAVEDLRAADVYAADSKHVYLALATLTLAKADAVPTLLRFDGAEFTKLPVPANAPLVGVSGTPDGTVYAAAFDEDRCPNSSHPYGCQKGGLYRSRAGGAFEAVPLPTPSKSKPMPYLPLSVRAYAEHGVWVLGRSGADYAVLHSRARKSAY